MRREKLTAIPDQLNNFVFEIALDEKFIDLEDEFLTRVTEDISSGSLNQSTGAIVIFAVTSIGTGFENV
jgi:hypothetical protein